MKDELLSLGVFLSLIFATGAYMIGISEGINLYNENQQTQMEILNECRNVQEEK